MSEAPTNAPFPRSQGETPASGGGRRDVGTHGLTSQPLRHQPAMKVQDLLQKAGIGYDHDLNPKKVVCNNCGSEHTFDRPNLVSVADSATAEVLWCPDCSDTPQA